MDQGEALALLDARITGFPQTQTRTQSHFRGATTRMLAGILIGFGQNLPENPLLFYFVPFSVSNSNALDRLCNICSRSKSSLGRF